MLEPPAWGVYQAERFMMEMTNSVQLHAGIEFEKEVSTEEGWQQYTMRIMNDENEWIDWQFDSLEEVQQFLKAALAITEQLKDGDQ